jgi:hypothetical protein
MANQIKKKYIENDAIDGLKILLQSDQTLRRLLEDGSTQDVIVYLEGLVSDEETRALAAESGLDTRITSLESQVGDDLQAAISQLQAEIAQEASDRADADTNLQSQITQEISDRTTADSNIQSQITALQGAEDVLFEDDASVYADGTAPIEDPTGRDGWYYKSAGSPDKVNWYFFDGSQTQVTVGQLDSMYAVATVDSSSTDTFHLAYYTMPLGDGNDAGSWYRSRQVFVPVEPFQRGEKALFWVKNQPDASVYPNLPRVQMQPTTVAGSSVGSNADSELLLTTVFGTNSAAEANTVELVANKLGINSSVYNKEYTLEIRGEFTLAGIKQSLLEESIERQNADSVIQENIDVEKARIDSILDASQADKDSFKEIVDLINSVDTENDQAFASYVTSNNAALAQEISDRESADSSLQDNIDSESSARQSADSALQANINAEASARQSADSALDIRVTALENVSFEKQNFVLSQSDISNGYINLSNQAIDKSIRLYVGRLAGFEGEDYQLSVVDSVTRITFIGSFASGGVEALTEGDKVKVAYSY